MGSLRFFAACAVLSLGRLRRQLWLLAGLALLCLLLPLGAGRAAEGLLSQGVGFHGVTLAIAAPEGDDAPALLERYMGGMEDIAQYCRVTAMEEGEALAALEAGQVTAALILPQRFIQGVMWGEDPDLRLVVAGDQPLESLLLLWVGQSASDILSAFQGGVYAVLDLYDRAPPPGLDRDQVVFDINLRYITLALDRAGIFRTREVSATGALPIPLHYALSLLCYFALSAAPLFLPLYTGGWLAFQRRLRAAGRGCAPGFFSAAAVGAGALLILLLPSLLLAGGGASPLALIGSALLMAAFCSLFAALCALAAGTAAGCGGAAFAVSLLSLLLGGGVIPPALLPPAVRRLSWLSPGSWLRQIAAWPLGYETDASAWACLGLGMAAMAAASLALYRRRADREEAGP